MCGRFTLTDPDPRMIRTRFGAEVRTELDVVRAPRFNIAPTQEVLVVIAADGGRMAVALAWDLFGSSRKRGAPLINLRSESALERASIGELLGSPAGRALVLADGFYEWLAPERPGAPRTPMRFTVDSGPFGFAGVYATRREGKGSCAIFTCDPNRLVATAHDRMPVILDGPEAEAAWLDPDLGAEDAAGLLVPLPAERMAAAPASILVNSADNEGPELLDPDAGENPPRLGLL